MERDTVQQKLSFHRQELETFSMFLRQQELKYNSGSISFGIKIFLNCHQYLITLKNIADKLRIESFFGVHVFLHELDHLFNHSISAIKSKLNDYQSDLSFENSALLQTLKQDLLDNSFLKFHDNSGASENVVFVNTQITQTKPFDELEKYYSVGTALANDPCTRLLLEALQKLRTEYPDVSPYSVIIGPSYMGKTQTAFTLANIINVMYVNFATIVSRYPQPIYALFSQFSELFESTTRSDTSESLYRTSRKRARDIKRSEVSYKTLGLIYTIIRTRKLHGDLDGFEWLKMLVNINAAMIPPMTVQQFNLKTIGNSYFLMYQSL